MIHKKPLKKCFAPVGLAVVALFFITARPVVHAQVYTNLHVFQTGNTTDGTFPNGVRLDGDWLYGASTQGGSSNLGCLYVVGTDGTGFAIRHDFAGYLGLPADGSSPNEPLVSEGTIFGTTQYGSTNSTDNFGTIFKLATNGGSYVILKSFTNNPDAKYPVAGLTLGGATLYGTSSAGGAGGAGTVFKIDTDGANYSILHNFSNTPDGATPRGGLWLDGATLYGVTSAGGSNNVGTVFQLDTNGGNYSVIYHFTNFPSGNTPYVGLTLNGGRLYGVSTIGGSTNRGTVFSLATNGTDFAVLHEFTASEGLLPEGTLFENAGWLYGTTLGGGSGSSGTLFQLQTNGANFQTLQNFTNALTGANPTGPLAFNGSSFFGTAYGGGPGTGGTLFRLQLSPVISLQPAAATITNGDPVTFNSAAVGLDPLSYQWLYRTNVLIAGATATTLTFTNANWPGVYSVRVTNDFGAVTSSFALLTVNSQPLLLSSGFDALSGSYSFTFVDIAGSTNRLWATTNLADANAWRVLATNIMATNAPWSYTDANTAKTNAAQFYRFSTP